MPAPRPEVLVPVVKLGVGTGRARVRDARTGGLVDAYTGTVTLVGGLVCLRLRSFGVEDGLHLVVLPGGARAWVVAAGESPRTAA